MQSSLVKRTAGVAVGAALVQLLMIALFAWPAARTAPRDVPIVVAGPGAAATAQRLEQASPGAFDIEIRTGADDARAAITDREAYGAIVTTPAGPQVLTASAASPMVAQQLTALAGNLAGPQRAAPVQDVVAADPDDPRGSGLATLILPLVMSSLAAAVLLTFAVPSVAWRARSRCCSRARRPRRRGRRLRVAVARPRPLPAGRRCRRAHDPGGDRRRRGPAPPRSDGPASASARSRSCSSATRSPG
ncbi:hypothetical protein [Actinomadura sp. CNU-125]|uniref:hypothetical protein n=1 Tax=Actinomadura sp. CNU-125 TaxID=1904961 RepID=UPI0009FAD0D7|nr:hypothetical protein [Actinomadura sp. CNU-125]